MGGAAAALSLSLVFAGGVAADAKQRGAVYVEDQGLCYETFATTDLTDQDRFS